MQTPTEKRERRWPPAIGAALLLALIVGLLFGLTFAGAETAWAQEAPAAPAREVTPDEVNAVAREIWCPLCSGVRLDACELKACEQMKDVIAIKLAEGEDTASIKAYFVEQYGPQVLGEPPRQGFNWLAWILPVVAVVAGGYFFWRTTQRLVKPAAPPETTMQSSALTPRRASAPTANPNTGDPASEEDEYTQKLEEELAKYG